MRRRLALILLASCLTIACTRSTAPIVGAKVVAPHPLALFPTIEAAMAARKIALNMPSDADVHDPRFEEFGRKSTAMIESNAVFEVLEVGPDYARVQWINPAPNTADGKVGYAIRWWR